MFILLATRPAASIDSDKFSELARQTLRKTGETQYTH